MPHGETILLSGQQGPAFFLVPVIGDVAMEDREIRRAMAKTSLRDSWRLAEASRSQQPGDEEIALEIDRVRRQRRKAG